MIVIGLTGSIGMGKSTTAAMFAQRGIPVLDADAVVHRLYAGDAVAPVEAAFPGTVVEGKVDRDRLSRAVLGDPQALARLEAIVHPLVRREQEQFLKGAREDGAAHVLLDIPLLFEGGGDKRVDKIVVVSCDEEMQRQRVLARPGMTEEKFTAIRARQVPDERKRAMADYIVDTGQGLAAAETQVDAIIRDITRLQG
jgi:dephospho-CoA kinase